jgi:hypothetical protein
MTRISAGRFGHWYSIIWIGALALFSAAAWFSDLEKTSLFVMIVSVALALSLIKKLYDWEWNLADEVFDDGDNLVVRRRGEEEVVPLSNITSVVYNNRWRTYAGPAQITLGLAHAGKFGSKIVFSPKMAGIDDDPSHTCVVAEELDERAKNARICGVA